MSSSPAVEEREKKVEIGEGRYRCKVQMQGTDEKKDEKKEEKKLPLTTQTK